MATTSTEREARLSELVHSLMAMLRRRWLTLALVTAIVAGLAITAIMLMPPKYQATASIRIDPSRSPVGKAADNQASLGSEAIETEVSVLNSPDLAREVVKRLNLQADPEFAKGLDSDEKVAQTAEMRLSRVADSVMRHLKVGRDKLTYVIDISFKSRDAAKSADIANAFAETYIATRVNGRIGTATQQADFYRQQLAEAGKALQAAQERVAQYRAATGIVENNTGGTINDQQIAPLSTQLATAEANAAEARSNLNAARRQVAGGGIDSVSAVRNSPVIADLRRQLAEVERSRGEIETRYGPKHPETIKVRDQIAALNQQIRAEASRAVASLQAEADAANAQVASLRSSLRVLKSQQASDTRASATIASYDQDVLSKKAAYDRLAQAADEASQSQRNSIAQAEIVDRAQTPTMPAPPSKAMLAAMALVVAFALGLAAAIVQEMMSNGLRSVADIEDRLGLPMLATLPRVGGRRGTTPAGMLITNPTSMYAEAFRNARASILGVKSRPAPRVVAITSALPDEGKSTAALSLARVSALAGTPTLLVECDVRRAQLRRMVGLNVQQGMVEVMRGQLAPASAIVADEVAGLDLLPVAEPFFSAEDLFGDGRLTRMLAGLRDRYGLIVLDLPPVLGLADARTVAAQADMVVLAVRWGATPERAAEQAVTALQADGTQLGGAIFTMVDPRSDAIGGMFYSGKYAAYYTPAA